MKRLSDKVAVITGAAAGIGKATAKTFLAEGAKVMLVDVDEEKLKSTVSEFNTNKAAFCVADVSTKEATIKYRDATIDTFGKIDVFFINAGIEGVVKPIADYPEEVFDKVVEVNIKGVWLACQHIIPYMTEGGSVMITSSVAGLKGFSGLGAYVASKHAEIGIMRVAALEFASKKIRVNTIHPGPINTRMMRSIETDISPKDTSVAQKGFEDIIPFGRYGEPIEIAKVALFLASDESQYITGSTYVVDGGLLAG